MFLQEGRLFVGRTTPRRYFGLVGLLARNLEKPCFLLLWLPSIESLHGFDFGMDDLRSADFENELIPFVVEDIQFLRCHRDQALR